MSCQHACGLRLIWRNPTIHDPQSRKWSNAQHKYFCSTSKLTEHAQATRSLGPVFVRHAVPDFDARITRDEADVVVQQQTPQFKLRDPTMNKPQRVPSDAVSSLIDSLKSNNEDLRKHAADEIFSMANGALRKPRGVLRNLSTALPALCENFSNEHVQFSALCAVEAIANEAWFSVGLGRDFNRQPDDGSVELLREIALVIVPNLIPLLKDNKAHIRISAATALGSCNKFAAAALPALLQAQHDRDYDYLKQNFFLRMWQRLASGVAYDKLYERSISDAVGCITGRTDAQF